MNRQLYFAYGANLCLAGMAVRCPSAKLVGKARLFEHRFAINRYGVATVVPTAGSTVFGVAWLLTTDDEARLDAFEGVDDGFYRKDKLKIQYGWRQPEALIYLAADSVPGVPRLQYLETILEAGKEYAFPGWYMQELGSWRRKRRVRLQQS